MTNQDLENATVLNESITVALPENNGSAVVCLVEIFAEVIIGKESFRLYKTLNVELKKVGTLVDPFANIRENP